VAKGPGRDRAVRCPLRELPSAPHGRAVQLGEGERYPDRPVSGTSGQVDPLLAPRDCATRSALHWRDRWAPKMLSVRPVEAGLRVPVPWRSRRHTRLLLPTVSGRISPRALRDEPPRLHDASDDRGQAQEAGHSAPDLWIPSVASLCWLRGSRHSRPWVRPR